MLQPLWHNVNVAVSIQVPCVWWSRQWGPHWTAFGCVTFQGSGHWDLVRVKKLQPMQTDLDRGQCWWFPQLERRQAATLNALQPRDTGQGPSTLDIGNFVTKIRDCLMLWVTSAPLARDRFPRTFLWSRQSFRYPGFAITFLKNIDLHSIATQLQG